MEADRLRLCAFVPVQERKRTDASTDVFTLASFFMLHKSKNAMSQCGDRDELTSAFLHFAHLVSPVSRTLQPHFFAAH